MHCQSIISAIVHHDCHGLSHLSNVPIRFGNLDCVTPITSHASINHKIPTYANRVLNFSWAVYSFGGGHFMSMILSCNLPFHVKLACDQHEYGHALFCKFTHCPDIFGGSSELLHHIHALGNSSQIHGYLIHSLHLRTVTRHLHSGGSRPPSFPSFAPYRFSNWWLQLLSLIMMGVALNCSNVL